MLLGSWDVVFDGFWVVGLLGCLVGLLGGWVVFWLLACWVAGLLGCLVVGLLGWMMSLCLSLSLSVPLPPQPFPTNH